MTRSRVYAVEGTEGKAEVFEVVVEGREDLPAYYEVCIHAYGGPRVWDYVTEWQFCGDEPDLQLVPVDSFEEARQLAVQCAESRKASLTYTGSPT